MTDDMIRIDPDAANADIQKLRNAIQSLEASQNSIRRLKDMASSMQGNTPTVIQEKCGELDTQIKSLISNLESTIQLIRRTLNEYNAKGSDVMGVVNRMV